MSFRTWLTSLATFGATVAGIKQSYDINVTPTELDPGQFPLLLIAQPLTGDGNSFGFGAFSANAPSRGAHAKHVLIVARAEEQEVNVMPALVDLEDAYCQAANTQKFLSDGVGQIVIGFNSEIVQFQHGKEVFWAIEHAHEPDLYM